MRTYNKVNNSQRLKCSDCARLNPIVADWSTDYLIATRLTNQVASRQIGTRWDVLTGLK